MIKSLNVMCIRTVDLTLILVIDKKFKCNVQTDSGSFSKLVIDKKCKCNGQTDSGSYTNICNRYKVKI